MSPPASLVDADWLEQAVQTIRRIAKRRQPFTSEDLRAELGDDQPEHQNRYGAAFNAAKGRRYIERVGYRPSRDPSRKGGVVAVWQLHPDEAERTRSYLGMLVESNPSSLFPKPVRIAENIAHTHGPGLPVSGDLVTKHRQQKGRRHG